MSSIIYHCLKSKEIYKDIGSLLILLSNISEIAPPICPPRWLLKSLSSLTVSWLPPMMQLNRYISGYFLELVSYDNTTVLQSASVSNILNYTFTGFSIGIIKLIVTLILCI